MGLRSTPAVISEKRCHGNDVGSGSWIDSPVNSGPGERDGGNTDFAFSIFYFLFFGIVMSSEAKSKNKTKQIVFLFLKQAKKKKRERERPNNNQNQIYIRLPREGRQSCLSLYRK